MNFDVKRETENVINWIKEWFYHSSGGAKGIIIGISGGKDSTVVAALCARAIGKENVFGVLMPNGQQKDIDDSIAVCKHIGINYRIVNIEKIYNSLIEQIRYDGTENIFALDEHTNTNIPPRIRMTVLYAMGQKMGYRVAGTGNYSESFIGYFTKWGDGACDFNPIEMFTTDEVVAIGDELGLPYELVHKIPSDGLCGKSDEENIGFSYDFLNQYIKSGHTDSAEVDKQILNAHIYSEHKRESIPFYFPLYCMFRG